LEVIVELTAALEKALHLAPEALRANSNLLTAVNACVEQLHELTRVDATELRAHLGHHKNIFQPCGKPAD